MPHFARSLPSALAGAIVIAAAVFLVIAQPAVAANPPTVTGISPNSGPATGGTAVTITGTGFASDASVTFDGLAATSVNVVSATQITAVTPGNAQGPATLIVTNTDGQGASLGNAFTYLGPVPTITGISPDSGPSSGGTTVTLTGTGFASGATVRFGGTAATGVTVVSSTQITAVTPPRPAGPATVQVTSTDGQTGSVINGFTYTPAAPPSITSVSPSTGTTGGGTAVTIVGTGSSPAPPSASATRTPPR